jgi:hypothetical protein
LISCFNQGSSEMCLLCAMRLAGTALEHAVSD